MGADARWVCFTCKTVCCRGGNPITINNVVSESDIRAGLSNLEELLKLVKVDKNGLASLLSFLEDLATWLSRHEGHNIHVGSDYTTDMMDLDDYHNESVDGKVSDYTRLEAQTKSVNEWRQTSINSIKKVLRECESTGAYGLMVDVDKAAVELYDKFSMGEA